MNYFKQIASRGWLGNALRVLTFGYYPSDLYDPGQVDWCIDASAINDWSSSVATTNDWSLSIADRFAWSPSSATVNDWSLSIAETTTWSISVEVLACD